MNLPLEAIPVPLWKDEHGGLRIGKSRVLLEMVLIAHQQGATPAQIADMYSTLELADVHAVLAWALRHPLETEAYLRVREEEAAEVRRRIEEAGLTLPGFKEKLLDRRARQEQGYAPPDQ